MKILCKRGLHHFVLVKGTHNKYYECKHCGKRKIEIPAVGYQPIDKSFLSGKNQD